MASHWKTNEDFLEILCFWGIQLGQLRVSNVLGWKSQKWVPEISGHLWKIWVGLSVGTLINFGNPLYFFSNDWFLELQAGPELHYLQDVKEKMAKLVFNPGLELSE